MDFMKRYDADGNSLVAAQPVMGSEVNFYAPNMCDACSWYVGSIILSKVLLVDSGNQTSWSSGHTNLIDLKHGRVYKEDDILAEDPSYGVTVEVLPANSTIWLTKLENSWGSSDGDFSIDYPNGNSCS